MSREIQAAYAAQSEDYATFSSQSFSWHFIEKPTFDRHLGSLYSNDAKMLDVGCGDGRSTKHFIQQGIAPSNIVGVDLSLELLQKAKQDLPEVGFAQADVATMALRPSSLDVIAANMVFEYLDEEGLNAALRAMSTGLKKGGTLIFGTTHPLKMFSKSPSEYPERGWKLSTTPWGKEIPIFRRPVNDFINATLNAGLTLDAIESPDIASEGRQANPEKYEKYSKYGDTRLFVRAHK